MNGWKMMVMFLVCFTIGSGASRIIADSIDGRNEHQLLTIADFLDEVDIEKGYGNENHFKSSDGESESRDEKESTGMMSKSGSNIIPTRRRADDAATSGNKEEMRLRRGGKNVECNVIEECRPCESEEIIMQPMCMETKLIQLVSCKKKRLRQKQNDNSTSIGDPTSEEEEFSTKTEKAIVSFFTAYILTILDSHTSF